MVFYTDHLTNTLIWLKVESWYLHLAQQTWAIPRNIRQRGIMRNKGVNAKLSLYAINWCSTICNPLALDNCEWQLTDCAHENEQGVVGISEDAKAIVPANIPSRNLEYHGETSANQWEQGWSDAVISMTFLDNGPSEIPASNLIQMCLVRLVKFLKLRKGIHVSFEEYLFKRNLVEHVHSAQNEMLSKRGPSKLDWGNVVRLVWAVFFWRGYFRTLFLVWILLF